VTPLEDLLAKWERERRERRAAQQMDAYERDEAEARALEQLRREPEDDQPRWRP